jgi:hypothetical protein
MAGRRKSAEEVSNEQHLVNALRYVLRGGGEAEQRAALDGLTALEASLPEAEPTPEEEEVPA